MRVYESDIKRDPGGISSAIEEGERIEMSREMEAELGRRDLFYLCKHILLYDKLGDFFHPGLCDFYVKNLQEIQLHLHPRGHFKTTIITVAGRIFMMLRDPNISQVVVTNTFTNAEKILREIRMHFIHNDKFRALYPTHAPDKKSEYGTSECFITPARTKKWLRMGSVEAASIDVALVSRHFDIAAFDDIVDAKNSATPEYRTKIYENYTKTLSIVDGKTRGGLPWHHIVGTRWHMNDAYCRMIDNNKVHGNMKVLLTQAYWEEKDQQTGEKYRRYLFPEQFPPEQLEFLRQEQKATFSALYLNNPVPAEQIAMDPEKLRYYSDTEALPKPMNKVITVDPSTSEQRMKGDPSVITVAGMDILSNVYILEIIRGWWDIDELIDRIFGAVKRHGIRSVGIESVSFSKWLSFYVNKRKADERSTFRVKEIKRDNNSKSVRQERIIPYLNTGKIFICDQEPELKVVKKEMSQYPFPTYDDFLDTLTDAIEMLKPPVIPKKRADSFRIPPRLQGGRNPFQTGYGYRAV